MIFNASVLTLITFGKKKKKTIAQFTIKIHLLSPPIHKSIFEKSGKNLFEIPPLVKTPLD